MNSLAMYIQILPVQPWPVQIAFTTIDTFTACCWSFDIRPTQRSSRVLILKVWFSGRAACAPIGWRPAMPAPGNVPGGHAGLPGRRVTEDGALRCHLAAEHEPVVRAQQQILLLCSRLCADPTLRADMLFPPRCSMAVCAAEGVPRLSLREEAPACGQISSMQQQL